MFVGCTIARETTGSKDISAQRFDVFYLNYEGTVDVIGTRLLSDYTTDAVVSELIDLQWTGSMKSQPRFIFPTGKVDNQRDNTFDELWERHDRGFMFVWYSGPKGWRVFENKQKSRSLDVQYVRAKGGDGNLLMRVNEEDSFRIKTTVTIGGDDTGPVHEVLDGDPSNFFFKAGVPNPFAPAAPAPELKPVADEGQKRMVPEIQPDGTVKFVLK